MKTLYKNSTLPNQKIQLLKCCAVFFPIATLLLWGIGTLRQRYAWLFYICGLLFGWICWTFAEYVVHRFLLHPKHAADKHGKGLHYEHHTHPTQIKITGRQRMIFLSLLLALITVNKLMPDYFSIFTGLCFGFVWYCYVHVLLHKRWAVKFFPRLQEYHVFHHCKFPDKCFGISSWWWDRLFQTTPPKEACISKRILRFYFGERHNHPAS